MKKGLIAIVALLVASNGFAAVSAEGAPKKGEVYPVQFMNKLLKPVFVKGIPRKRECKPFKVRVGAKGRATVRVPKHCCLRRIEVTGPLGKNLASTTFRGDCDRGSAQFKIVRNRKGKVVISRKRNK